MEIKKGYYTLKEVGIILGMHPIAVKRMIDDKKIKAIDVNASDGMRKQYRIPVSEIENIQSKLQVI